MVNAHKNYRYVGACLNAACGEDIQAMIATARRVSRETFVANTNEQDRREVEQALGYDRHMPISKAPNVFYRKGVYRGIPAYYLTHSAIEYIFTLQGKLGPSAGNGRGVVGAYHFTKEQIEEALRQFGGRVSEVAKHLNISQPTFRSFMKKYGVPYPSPEDRSRFMLDAASRRRARMSEKEREEFSRTQSEGSKKWWASMSEKEREEFSRTQSEARKKRRASMSEEEMEEDSRVRSERLKEWWASLTPEEYKEMVAKQKAIWKKYSPEEAEAMWNDVMAKKGGNGTVGIKRSEYQAPTAIGARAKYNDPSIDAKELVKLAKKNPKTYTNPNLPWDALRYGALRYPYYVEHNPVLGLLELEDPSNFALLKNEIQTGWRTHVIRKLSPKHRLMFSADCVEHVLPLFYLVTKSTIPQQVIDAVRSVANGERMTGPDAVNPNKLADFSADLSRQIGVAQDSMRRRGQSDEADVFNSARLVAAAANAAIMFVGEERDSFNAAYYAAQYAINAVTSNQNTLKADLEWQTDRVRYYYGLEHPEYQPLVVVGGAKINLTKEQVEMALREANWLITAAASNLGMSKSGLRGIMERYGITITEEQAQLAESARRDKIRKSRAEQTPEERALHVKRIQEARQQWTPEEKQQYLDKQLQSLRDASPEKKAERGEKLRRARANMSPERLAEYNEKLSRATSEVWATMPYEERERRSAIQKQLWSEKTEEEKEAASQRLREIRNSFSVEEYERWHQAIKDRFRRYSRDEIDKMYADLMASKKPENIGGHPSVSFLKRKAAVGARVKVADDMAVDPAKLEGLAKRDRLAALRHPQASKEQLVRWLAVHPKTGGVPKNYKERLAALEQNPTLPLFWLENPPTASDPLMWAIWAMRFAIALEEFNDEFATLTPKQTVEWAEKEIWANLHHLRKKDAAASDEMTEIMDKILSSAEFRKSLNDQEDRLMAVYRQSIYPLEARSLIMSILIFEDAYSHLLDSQHAQYPMAKLRIAKDRAKTSLDYAYHAISIGDVGFDKYNPSKGWENRRDYTRYLQSMLAGLRSFLAGEKNQIGARSLPSSSSRHARNLRAASLRSS